MALYKLCQDGKNAFQVYGKVREVLLGRDINDWQEVEEGDDFHLLFGDRGNVDYAKLSLGVRPKVVNYYRGSRDITNKVPLAENLRRYAELTNKNAYDWIPLTFIIVPRADKVLEEMSATDSGKNFRMAKKKAYMEKDERQALREYATANPAAIFIAKSDAGAKGDNIFIDSDVEAVLAHVDAQHIGKKLPRGWVVQLYLDRPFLIHQRKFDIRYWVLLDQDYRIYGFEDAVCRLCSEDYKNQDLTNVYMHLTNHCLQTDHPTYGEIADGNEMFMEAFQQYLESTNEGKSVQKDLNPQIHEIVTATLLSLKSSMNTDHLDYKSFQLMGFDFMIDADFKAWLIEVNATPASAECLLEDMVASLVHVTIDRIYEPSKELEPPRGKQFELIYDPT